MICEILFSTIFMIRIFLILNSRIFYKFYIFITWIQYLRYSAAFPKRALVRSFIFQLHFQYLTGQNEGSIPGVTISGVFIFFQRSVPGHSRPPRPRSRSVWGHFMCLTSCLSQFLCKFRSRNKIVKLKMCLIAFNSLLKYFAGKSFDVKK